MGGDKHSLFGIWTDKENNVYVANYSGQVVKQVNSKGVIKNIVYSLSPWSPTSGIFDKEGNLWLLEYSVTNEVRVREITKEDLGKTNPVKAYAKNNLLPVSMGAALLVIIFYIIKRIWKKRKSIAVL